MGHSKKSKSDRGDREGHDHDKRKKSKKKRSRSRSRRSRSRSLSPRAASASSKKMFKKELEREDRDDDRDMSLSHHRRSRRGSEGAAGDGAIDDKQQRRDRREFRRSSGGDGGGAEAHSSRSSLPESSHHVHVKIEGGGTRRRSHSRSRSRSNSPSSTLTRYYDYEHEDQHDRRREDSSPYPDRRSTGRRREELHEGDIRNEGREGRRRSRSRSKSPSTSTSARYYDYDHAARRRREDPNPYPNPDHRRPPTRRMEDPEAVLNFDIRRFKVYFDRMFFRDTDIIRKGSVQYDDFWKFYEKIKRIQAAKKSQSAGTGNDNYMEIEVGGRSIRVPECYAKRHTVPFSLKYTTVDDYIYNLNPNDQEVVRVYVPPAVIEDFLQILLYFIDFLQKERFSKLRKLRETQEALPISQFRQEIVDTLAKYNVLIIAGDTGCGKSTQVPQYLLRAGYENIACTQPRRIACLSLSKRVAFETLNEYGTQIGYQIRFEKSKTQHTKVVFITEGLLLRQVSADSMLTNYNVIVLDEVHERHLHGDFLLGIVKCLVYQREDVKVILMSATINTELFQNYFQGLAPILQVPGRLYPIKVHYRPVSVEELTTKTGKLNPAPYVRVMQLIDDKFPQDERGDVLMFLSGVNEISIVIEAAKMYAEVTKRWIVMPLHSMLSIDDQDKTFDYAPEGIRKCIVATNIAETSITIDGIRFVVDTGKVKEMAYDTQSKLQRLKEFWISKASAEQRKGRAGRTGPGVCYRIYSESEYDELQAYSTPEIQRVPLDSLLLQMISIGIPDCRKFPFIEPPSPESIENSILRLKDQGALNDDETLTPIGTTLSNLPVDVTLGKMLIVGTLFEQVEAVLSLAAALSVQSPFTSWAHRDPDCVAARKTLDSDHGDPLTLLNAYKAWLEEKANDSSRTKRWCKRRGFEEQRFYEMTKLRQQFKTLLKDAGLIKEQQGPSMSSAERAMRHGEVRQLRSLKKEFHMAAPRKKKFLKLDEDYGQGEDDLPSDTEDGGAGDGNIDIKDVEFRLKNDSRQVKDLLHNSSAYGYEDVSMLKVILCSGLYPQLAVADDFNKYKSDVDQMFHTKGKGFTVLHPMSVFANQPDALALNDSDIIDVPHMATKLMISAKHQLLCYVTLLETNKPYLMNTFRMPAAQTLFLLAHTIDTDPAMTRFVFDNWLEVVFTDSASSRSVLVSAMNIRDAWSALLENRLDQKDEPQASDVKKSRELSSRIVRFLRSETFYTIKRLLAADQKDMYNRYYSAEIPHECDDDEKELRFESDWDVMQNGMKGGLSLASYLTYGCLYGEEPDPEDWTCPLCERNLMGLPLELLCHNVECKRKRDLEEERNANDEDMIANRKPHTRPYFCVECQQHLSLTPVEILRHKRSHTKVE